MKQIRRLGLIGLCLLILGACVPTKSVETQNAHTKSQSTKSSSTKAVWSAEKAQELSAYMLKDWGPDVGHLYKEYTPTNLGNFYGLTVPTGLLADVQDMVPALDGTVARLIWSVDGQHKEGETAVVAVFSDIESTNSQGSLYVFTIQQGEGKVWVSQQNQGNEENTFYLKEVDNQELREFYNSVIAETSQNHASSPVSETETSTSSTLNQLVVDTKQLTIDQCANWAAAHKAREYGSPYTRADFLTHVTTVAESRDGLVYIEVRENHDSATMKAAGADASVGSNTSFYRINAAGELELQDILSASYQVVATTYFEE